MNPNAKAVCARVQLGEPPSCRFPFRQIGEEVDYYGAVAPYVLDLDELDAVLTERLPWLLAEFRAGLDDRSWGNEPEPSFLAATAAT